MADAAPLSPSPLYVVSSPADVRLAWELGVVAWTFDELRQRLHAWLLPDVVLASELEATLALSDVLGRLAPLRAPEPAGAARIALVNAVRSEIVEAHRMAWLEALASGESLQGDAGARAVAAAARRLERALASRGLVDPASLDERIARSVATAAPAEIVAALGGAREAVALVLPSWSPSGLLLWRALDARLSLVAGSARIETVTFERPLDAARAPDPTARLADAVAEALDAPPIARPIAPVLGDLGFDEALPSLPLSRVEVRKGDSPYAEARAVADAVLDALAAGATPDRLAVVADRDSPVREHVARLLEELGVPVFQAEDAPHGEAGLLAAVLGVLDVAVQGAPRLRTAALLRSPYLDARRLTGLPDEGAARRVLHALARGLEATRGVASSSTAEMLERTALASPAGSGLTGEERDAMGALGRRFGEVLATVVLAKPRAEHAVRVRELVSALGIVARPGPAAAAWLAGEQRQSQLSEAETRAYARDANAMAKVESALDAYRSAADRLQLRETVDLATFRDELAETVCGDVLAPGPRPEGPSAGAVRLCTLDNLPSRERALLVVADCHEGALGMASKGASILSSETKAALALALEPALRPSVPLQRDARAVRLAAAAHEAARIVVSFATRDDEGAIRPPHPLAAWLERAGAHTTAWRDEVVPERPLTVREELLSALLRSPSAASRLAPLAARRAWIEDCRERAFGATTRPAEEAALPALEAALRAVLAQETGGGVAAMSVTALDRFGACAFQGYAAQVLGARRPPVVPDVVGPREEGILLHGALAAAFDATRSLWAMRPRDPRVIREGARQAALSFLRPDASATRLLRAALDEIAERVARVVDHAVLDEAWDFERAEVGFGKEQGGWPAVALDDGAVRVTLAGSIDRVDRSHDGVRLRIIDYKRSEDGARRLTEELGETSFQLAVYGRAAAAALSTPSTDGLYLPTRRLARAVAPVSGEAAAVKPEPRRRASEAAWARAHRHEEGASRFERRALAVLAAVRHGELAPRPAHPDVCRLCDHDGACRKPRFVIESALAAEEEDAHDRA